MMYLFFSDNFCIGISESALVSLDKKLVFSRIESHHLSYDSVGLDTVRSGDDMIHYYRIVRSRSISFTSDYTIYNGKMGLEKI